MCALPSIRLEALNRAQGPSTVVLIHGAPGGIDEYEAVASQLEPDVPALGIRSPLLRDPSSEPTFAQLAAHYADEIAGAMEVPLHLAGAQLGGVLAWEVARSLIGAGRRVESVVMIDSRAPEASMRTRDVGPAAVARALVLRELRRTEQTTAVPDLAIDGPIADADGGPSVALVDRVRASLESLGLPVADELRTVMMAMQRHSQAFFRHEPGPLAIPVLLLESTDEAPDHPRPPTLGWDDLAGKLSKAKTPGTHFSVLSSSHAGALATHLRAWVRTDLPDR